MTKWIKVDPADIKVGDKVKAAIGNVSTIEGVIDYVGDDHLQLARFRSRSAHGRRLGTSASRRRRSCQPGPEEPPAGSFFRADRSGDMYRAYGPIGPDRCYLGIGSGTGGAQRLWSDWEQLTEPGDTWTLLEPRGGGEVSNAGRPSMGKRRMVAVPSRTPSLGGVG